MKKCVFTNKLFWIILIIVVINLLAFVWILHPTEKRDPSIVTSEDVKKGQLNFILEDAKAFAGTYPREIEYNGHEYYRMTKTLDDESISKRLSTLKVGTLNVWIYKVFGIDEEEVIALDLTGDCYTFVCYYQPDCCKSATENKVMEMPNLHWDEAKKLMKEFSVTYD